MSSDAIFSPLAIAPMIDWTNTHFRVLMRLIAPKALLYTEMQTPGAIRHKPERALGFDACEQPLALQLGGSVPEVLAECARIAEEKGFAEVNLNLGCPSDRVLAGRFGACMMQEPQLVSECIAAMKEAVSIPVSAKTRIGIDLQDSYEFFAQFAEKIISAGADKLIIHARKAWLHGLNPKQNRTIPPINYDYVYRLKKEFSTVPVIVNGNISTISAIESHLEHVDGVMLGRLACDNPYALAEIHRRIYPDILISSRFVIFQKYSDYAKAQLDKSVPLSVLLKPVFNLCHGQPGNKQWKALLQSMLQNKDASLLDIAAEWLANQGCVKTEQEEMC
ncbi:tRNA-dihydrouridine synthase A [Legionella birminghamensis]|uniref:tRNA-dihydrouridine(20/20a) synthase n=1 Tax=Legionella birminghamensis TaxID=28083 RepID=A0A378I964_9GAMM|nr:tRNA dihydrouridine(20/20a) synthase DusA [Legionella birminghamensis]KTC74847.1 tRNA-dihydrouridine synthase A [Legionella birminghamensis]STX31748.1 tRNA-dihydrouridine synthase A [Legionella birminghamensis]